MDICQKPSLPPPVEQCLYCCNIDWGKSDNCNTPASVRAEMLICTSQHKVLSNSHVPLLRLELRATPPPMHRYASCGALKAPSGWWWPQLRRHAQGRMAMLLQEHNVFQSFTLSLLGPNGACSCLGHSPKKERKNAWIVCAKECFLWLFTPAWLLLQHSRLEIQKRMPARCRNMQRYEEVPFFVTKDTQLLPHKRGPTMWWLQSTVRLQESLRLQNHIA